MAWERIHKTINGNGGVSIRTGYATETVTLLNWSGGANNGVKAYTSPINIPIKGDIAVLVQFQLSSNGNPSALSAAFAGPLLQPPCIIGAAQAPGPAGI